jgi:hypothetical protein
VCIYADLNLHPEEKVFKSLYESLSKEGLEIAVPKQATRRGYSKQADTTIDYFILNN